MASAVQMSIKHRSVVRRHKVTLCVKDACRVKNTNKLQENVEVWLTQNVLIAEIVLLANTFRFIVAYTTKHNVRPVLHAAVRSTCHRIAAWIIREYANHVLLVPTNNTLLMCAMRPATPNVPTVLLVKQEKNLSKPDVEKMAITTQSVKNVLFAMLTNS
jgi:hypothetical protein